MVQVAERSENYFTKDDHGIEVIITGGSVLASSKGSDYLQLEFELDGKEGNTGYNNYITEKALPYTAQRVQSILTHNATTDEEKAKVLKDIEAVPDDAFGDWAIKELTGRSAFLHISFSDSINPKNGLPYLERNLAGYEPAALKEPVQTAQSLVGGTPASDAQKSNIPF